MENIINTFDVYDPEFVAKIKRAEDEESVEVDPENLWESLGLKLNQRVKGI